MCACMHVCVCVCVFMFGCVYMSVCCIHEYFGCVRVFLSSSSGLHPGTQNGPTEDLGLEGLRAVMPVQLVGAAPAGDGVLQDVAEGVG